MYLHVFITWIIANLLHPFVMLLFFVPEIYDFSFAIIGTGIIVLIYSLALSFPSLLLAWIIMNLIRRLQGDVINKFLAWLFLATSIPILNYILLSFIFFKGEIDFEEIKIVIPSTISVGIAILIRINYFFKHFNKAETID